MNELPWLTGPGQEADGVLTITTLVLPDGTVADTAWVSCTPDGQAPVRPAAPPTRQEIWDSVVAARPTVDLSPAAHLGSLAGFPTGLWYDGPTTATASLTLRGWTVTADLTAIAFAWDMGSPDIQKQTRHTSTHPGTSDDWAAEHVYETSGLHPVAVSVTWTGTATLTGPVVNPVVTDLGQAQLTTTVDYRVRQSIPVLTG
ncbi:MAG: hypothetical protein GY745_23500 [Actinomycetia bacterium]|nr:hypothetical protein [Actinomycetes bacterium]MCP4087982.1 hypothetical protein [Actinomycetes bacterium]